MYAIESNIAMPKRTTRGPAAASVYPFAEMQPGDSFFVPCEETEFKKVRMRLAAAIVRRVKAAAGEKYSTRMINEESVNGIRVWRVK